LTDSGVLAINVGRGPGDRRLVEAVTATLLTVFPSIYTIDVPGSFNSIVFATVKQSDSAHLVEALNNMDSDTHPLLRKAMETAADNLVPTIASEVVFTDERAPVETMIDSIVIRFLIEEGAAGLPGLSG